MSELLFQRCRRCGMVYPHRPDYLHTCTAGVRTFYSYYRLRNDDVVHSLVLVNADDTDPLLAVDTLAPDGTVQKWAMTRDAGRLVFWPPDGYSGSQGMCLHFSKDIQRHESAPREVLEREALGNRVSSAA